MGKIRAISKRLLPHTAILKHSIGKDRWDEPTYDDTELSYVRFDPSSKVIQSKTNQELQLNSIMFYDYKNSRPKDVIFDEGDILIFDDKIYKIVAINCPSGFEKHHLELGLI